MTDGRDDCLDETLRSVDRQLGAPFTHRIINDDTGDLAHSAALSARYPDYEVLSGVRRRGFGGAIQYAWNTIKTRPESHVFHLEDDFTFNEPVDVHAMASVLDANPQLTQMALQRQPWSVEEIAAGCVIDLAECTERNTGGFGWLEHRKFFTTNPCVYRRALCERGWPDGNESEGRFAISLFQDPAATSGYWSDKPLVSHIGVHRTGTGY